MLLLRDIRRVFSDRDRMRTSDILTGLNRMEEGPWGSIRRGDPLDARGLATRLGRYGIGPKFQHSGGEPPYKGYSRTQFEDAWSRYLCRRRNPRGTRFIGFRGFRGFTAGWRSR